MITRTPRASKRILAAIAAAGIIASTFAIASPVQATQTVVEARIGGLDRYATSAQVAQATFAAPNANIILASGLNFPDGLASAGFAGAANAPVLLTDPNNLPGVTQNALGAIFGSSATKTVHIVGGEAAVSAAVAAQVTALGYTVNRISGANRYETAAAIATFQSTLAPVGITTVAGVPLRTAFVATGENFPDALSGGAPAFSGKHPILLTATASLPASTSAALTSLSVQRVVLLGGEAAVSAAVATEIAAIGTGIRVDRISGANRGATASALASLVVASLANGGFDFYGANASAACLGAGVTPANIALIVSGAGFADALSAGPHAGVCKAPILIAGSPSTATFLTANTAKVGVVRAIGGAAAVSAESLTAAAAAATVGTPTSMLAINEANPVIKVDFSTAIATAGSVKVNNGGELCGATATVLPAGALAAGTCYLITANGVTTLYTANGANLAVGDTVVASGFKTSVATGAVTAATASMTVPATPAVLTGTIAGAIVSGTAPTVTFNRPVVLVAGAANVTIVKASAPAVTVDIGPLTFVGGFATQLATTATINLPAAQSPLTAGDVITVKQAAVTGVASPAVASLNLQASISAVVQSAGAAPALSAATGVLTATGGILLTNGAVNDTNVVVQAAAALPAGAVKVEYVTTNAGTPSVATTAAAVLDNTTGVTTITVKLGTDAAGTIAASAQQVAGAINAGASATAAATASNPLSTTSVGALAPQNVGIGSRTLAVTGTSTKPLTAVTVAQITYDGNNDGFADPGVGAPTLTTFTGTAASPSSSFVVTFNLGVGTLPTNTGAAFSAGTSKALLAPGSLTDATAVNSTGQIITIAAP